MPFSFPARRNGRDQVIDATHMNQVQGAIAAGKSVMRQGCVARLVRLLFPLCLILLPLTAKADGPLKKGVEVNPNASDNTDWIEPGTDVKWVRFQALLYQDEYNEANPDEMQRFIEQTPNMKRVVVLMTDVTQALDLPSSLAFGRWAERMEKKWGKHVHVWEIWNEPDHVLSEPNGWRYGFPGPDNFHNWSLIYNGAYNGIKRANPNRRVMNGGLAGEPQWLKDAEERYHLTFDAVNVHLYRYYDPHGEFWQGAYNKVYDTARLWPANSNGFPLIFVTETSLLCHPDHDWCPAHNPPDFSHDFFQKQREFAYWWHNLSSGVQYRLVVFWFTVNYNGWQFSDLVWQQASGAKAKTPAWEEWYR